jgi:hypothetical protein
MPDQDPADLPGALVGHAEEEVRCAVFAGEELDTYVRGLDDDVLWDLHSEQLVRGRRVVLVE